jgi:hypothetical protein
MSAEQTTHLYPTLPVVFSGLCSFYERLPSEQRKSGLLSVRHDGRIVPARKL